MSNKIYYTDDMHEKTLKDLLMKHGKIYEKHNNEVDIYYLPAFYIFTANEELRRKCLKYIVSDGILFQKMKIEQDFSSGLSRIIQLSHHLFNEGESIGIVGLIGVLDGELFEVAIQAIKLRKYGRKYSDL